MFLIFAVLLWVPDGTLVMSSKPGTLVGNIAKRMTGGDKYTHIGIVFNNHVYESDWPIAKKTPVHLYGKARTVNDYYYPKQPISNVAAMMDVAERELGKPYKLRNYLNPRSKPTYGTYCSPYVAKVFTDSGTPIPKYYGYEPQRLLSFLNNRYYFHHQVKR
jgi:hypothetical protein